MFVHMHTPMNVYDNHTRLIFIGHVAYYIPLMKEIAALVEYSTSKHVHAYSGGTNTFD